MNLAQRAIRKFSNKYRLRQFDQVVEGVFSTPPLLMQRSNLLFVSMCCHRDVSRYLLALKSLYRFVGSGSALIIDDGTLSAEDRAVLLKHVPLCTFVDMADIDTGPCPKKGCWERLMQVIDLTREHYVIQVDSDTLTRAPVPELVQAWRDNRSWLLGTDVGQALAPGAEVAAMVRSWPHTPPSIGMLAEMALADAPELARAPYVHASAGFTGFAQGAFQREALYAFSVQMQSVLGKRWSEWGTEQIASNWMVANAPDPLVLPFARYACYEPWVDPDTRAFLHFIGSYRYDQGVYARMARDFIDQGR